MRKSSKLTWLLVFTFFYISLWAFTPKVPIFYDYGGLSGRNAQNYFEIIIGATASIFGILIAVLLLSFEILKQKPSRKEESFLQNQKVIFGMHLAVSILIYSLISYVLIKDFTHPKALAIGYYVGLLFVIFVGTIFPLVKSILRSTDTLKTVKKDIESIDFNNINGGEELLKPDIRNEFIFFVREGDFKAYSDVLNLVNKKFIILIENADKSLVDSALGNITQFWDSAKYEALRVGNFHYYDIVWASISDLYKHIGKKGISLVEYRRLNDYLYEFSNFLFREKSISSLAYGLDVLMNIIKKSLLPNCPPQEIISELYAKHEKENVPPNDWKSNFEWNSILTIIINVTYWQGEATTIRNRELFIKTKKEISSLCVDIAKGGYSHLGNYQERDILLQVNTFLLHYGKDAIRDGLFKDTLDAFDIEPNLFSGLVRREQPFVMEILQKISEFVVEAESNQTLHLYTLRQWGAIARYSSSMYSTNETAKNLTRVVFDLLVSIKRSESVNRKDAINQISALRDCLLRDEKNRNAPIIQEIAQRLEENDMPKAI